MAGDTDLTTLLVAIATLDHRAVVDLLTSMPSLATAGLARRDEFFLAERLAQVHEGDTALHSAGFSYDPQMARDLITRGSDIRARNRRGAEPLHAAVISAPGSASWNPACQRDVIVYLIEAGADPNAAAAEGVTPLHRAVRNRGHPPHGRLDLIHHLGRADLPAQWRPGHPRTPAQRCVVTVLAGRPRGGRAAAVTPRGPAMARDVRPGTPPRPASRTGNAWRPRPDP